MIEVVRRIWPPCLPATWTPTAFRTWQHYAHASHLTRPRSQELSSILRRSVDMMSCWVIMWRQRHEPVHRRRAYHAQPQLYSPARDQAELVVHCRKLRQGRRWEETREGKERGRKNKS